MERLGHIADRQSKYLSDGNVGVRPLRFVSLWEKLMACPQSGHYVPMLGPFDGRGRKSDGQRTLSLPANQLPSPSPLRHQLLPASLHHLAALFRSLCHLPTCPIRCVKRYRIIMAVYVGRRLLGNRRYGRIERGNYLLGGEEIERSSGAKASPSDRCFLRNFAGWICRSRIWRS